MNAPFCATGLLRMCLAVLCAATLLLQPVAAIAADVTSFIYDEDRAGAFNVGRLTSRSNAAATIRYDHDENGNVVSQRWEVDGQTYTHTFTYAPNGQLLRRNFADSDAVPSATGTYQYDGAGRLQSIPGLITHISYNAGSDPVATTYGNGIVEARTYDPNRRWLMSISAQSGQTGLFEESYTRSDKGLITEVVSNRTNGNWHYGYDTVDRLVSATNLDDGLLSQSFAYDAADNITFNSSVGAYTYPDPSNPQPHAVTQAGGQTYSYDVKGNLVSGGGRTITYDGEDRPVSITYNGQTTSFVYAPDGKRLKKITGGQTTLYLGADEEITPAGTHIKHPHSDVRKAGTGINWMHRDHLSSVKLMSDATGAVISENFFRPYGERSDVQIPPLGTPRESKGWIGERDDPETGLNYLNARYYDPVLARFISPDWFPADMPLVGTNRYAYGLNNPVWLKDPSGNVNTHDPINNPGGTIGPGGSGYSGGDNGSGDFDHGGSGSTDTHSDDAPGRSNKDKDDFYKDLDRDRYATFPPWYHRAGVECACGRLNVYGLGGFGGPRGSAGKGSGKGAKTADKEVQKETGSYTVHFPDGSKYHGKGARKRGEDSARRVSRENDLDAKRTEVDWTRAKSDREAFKAEDRRIQNDGGIANPRNHNKINSPGRKYNNEDGGGGW
ncbi:RHS repeat domain-containing protein [Roseibium sp. MMSF_3412]|uniref:RHS repeat domain-containing protein n=1 Tax=Roseibium sp. MMSF_3412 TaxID=3046712 RepID=UPI00273F4D7C|nr:RHS repeat-associated core domain-containing protein [Roseibium sp. MMSF_3412]